MAGLQSRNHKSVDGIGYGMVRVGRRLVANRFLKRPPTLGFIVYRGCHRCVFRVFRFESLAFPGNAHCDPLGNIVDVLFGQLATRRHLIRFIIHRFEKQAVGRGVEADCRTRFAALHEVFAIG